MEPNDSWFKQVMAKSDKERIKRNLERLESLRAVVHDLGYFVVSSNSGGYEVLQELLADQLVMGRPKVHEKLTSALVGENNQKIALDAPTRFQRIMREAEELIQHEIGREKKALRELGVDYESKSI